MGSEITVRELLERLGDGPAVVVRGMVWHVAGAKQQASRSDGSMRVQLRLVRLDPQDSTTKRLLLDVEPDDRIQLAPMPST
jgi:hypothetical protein